ncbi:E3 ubiquitin-protein ligase RBBP6-like [Athene noctua]|uniref:E3 ubiquitin-protein ligase RBBP6-like n=1 Tax=Athene noctua TaxID=126797 RepID=UPI003EBFC04F
MPCVHYQFSSQLRRDTVTFSGLHISLGNLKREIMGRQKLKAANCDLRVTNAETGEEYTDANALIPKNSSVVVRRVPVRGVKTTSKTPVITRTEPASGTSRAIEDSSAAIPLAQLIKDSNFQSVRRLRKSTGIPRSFMVEVEDPNMKGAMLTPTGRYAIPIINA